MTCVCECVWKRVVFYSHASVVTVGATAGVAVGVAVGLLIEILNLGNE